MADEREQGRATSQRHAVSYSTRPFKPLSLDRVQSLLADRYAVSRVLGEGGTSIVYLANDRERNRAVAVKVLRPELSEAVVATRFLREIELGQTLTHENVLPIFESGVADGELYYTMPFVDGETLQQRLARETQLPIADTLSIARAVANALDYAHALGVIHRDIKPANILLDGDRVVVADFGIARAMAASATSQLTESGIVIGTAMYMSPEQGTAERQIDGRTDVYSLGCIVYEMLGGEPPFTGPTARAIIARHCHEEPRSLRVIRPAVPPAMQRVVEKALAKVVNDRYATAGAFADALESAARADAVEDSLTPSPSSWFRRQQRWARRTIAVSVATAGIAAAALAGRWIRNETRARAEAARIARADTTRIVVFPIEADTASSWGGAAERDLRRAFTAWHGIEVVDPSSVADALRRSSDGPLSATSARSVALDFRAARYVRISASIEDSRRQLRGMLFDVARPESPIAELTVSATSGEDSSIQRLADWLLVRPNDTVTFGEAPVGTNSLPAYQAFLRGRAEIERWNLDGADSAFAQSVALDARYARASLWLALVRWWAGQTPPTWTHAVEVAVIGRDQIPAIDQRKLDAMQAVRAQDAPRACGLWERNTMEQPSDFTAWFGSAKCLRDDNVVIPDKASASGWRFRTGYEAAIRSYVRALQLRPAMVSALRADAFAKVRQWLWTSGRVVRPGLSRPAPANSFVAFPSLDHDTLAFVPYPRQLIESGDAGTMRKLRGSVDVAVRRQRQLFRDVALQWVATAPSSATAEQALAVALLYLGDASAVEHIGRAVRLSHDREELQRLVATELWIRTQLALPDDVAALRTIRARIDSLIRAAEPTAVEPGLLGSLAALIGRVNAAERLDRRVRAGSSTNAPIAALSRSLVVYAAFGAPLDSIRALEARVESLIVLNARPELRDALRAQFLKRAAQVAYPAYLFAVLASADTSGSSILSAISASARADTGTVRRILAETRRVREALAASEVGVDAVYTEARLAAWTGDDRQAIAGMDLSLSGVRSSPSLGDPVVAAMLMRTMMFRVELADKTGDVTTAAKWAGAVTALWSDADAPLQPMVTSMRRFTTSQ